MAEKSERAAELAAAESARRDAGQADDAPAREIAAPDAANSAVSAPAEESASATDETAPADVLLHEKADGEPAADDAPREPVATPPTSEQIADGTATAAAEDEPTAAAEPSEDETVFVEESESAADEDQGEAVEGEDEEGDYSEERVVVIRRGVFYAVAALAIVLIAVLAGLNVYQSVKGDAAVATVNGTKITRSAYDKQIARLADPNSGAQVATSTLDQMINTTLLEQDAAKQKVTASPDEIDAELAKQKAGFSSDADYRTALQGAHLTETQFRDQLKDQVLIQKLVLNKVTVSEDAIQQEFSQNKDTTYQGKTIDQVHDQIKTNLLQQQQQTAEQTYFDNLQAKAKISRHIPGA